jgi:uncharacterized membrane protein
MDTKKVASITVLSALYAIAILTIQIPSPTGGYTHIGDTVVFMAALLFGSKVGALVGVVGAVTADLYVGYSRWFLSIPAHGLEGFVAGFAAKKSTKTQVICCAVGGVLMATTYFIVNIFIKGFSLAVISYARDVFAQTVISMILGITITKTVEKTLGNRI